MPKLVRDDAGGNADRGGDLMQGSAQLAAECHAAIRAGEKKGIGIARILASQRTEPIHNPADEGIHRNKALGPQLAKGHMNGPLILADGAQTIQRQIEALADAHAGVAEEQQGVAVPIVASQQFLLDQPVLLGRQWPGQTPGGAWDIIRADHAGQEGYAFGPGQFFEETA
jgi:hypothetical protein